MKKLLFTVLCCMYLCGCEANNETSNTTNNNQNSGSNTETTISAGKIDNYEVDKMFVFDNLEITVGSNYSFSTIDNEFSEYNGQDVIKVPVTVKNLKDETHGLNMFFYNFYGSQGVQLSSVASYFDDCIDYAGNIRPGSSYTKYFYLIYDGDGLYTIEFDNYSQKITIDLNIKK